MYKLLIPMIITASLVGCGGENADTKPKDGGAHEVGVPIDNVDSTAPRPEEKNGLVQITNKASEQTNIVKYPSIPKDSTNPFVLASGSRDDHGATISEHGATLAREAQSNAHSAQQAVQQHQVKRTVSKGIETKKLSHAHRVAARSLAQSEHEAIARQPGQSVADRGATLTLEAQRNQATAQSE
ncbi:hypothetical protein, partial [Vibrio comitans]